MEFSIKIIFFLFFLVITCLSLHQSKTDFKSSPTDLYLPKLNKPYNVSYNHRSLLLNGEKKLFLSGSVHYPRAMPSEWRNILRESKKGGINLIETYVFWNLHEPKKGVFNFENEANIQQFLDLAMEEELYVTLRIGPYVCAEWNFGGFPEWLREIDGMVFRDYNEPYMKEMSSWMTTIVELLRPYFASEGGPIILAQVENEYEWVEKAYGESGRKYALWAIEFAQSLNTQIPWIMCAQGDIAQAINTCNGFYCHNWVDGHFQRFQGQPALWTELWTGWFLHFDEPKPTRPAEDIVYAVLMFIARGGSMVNHYMYYGGSNFARTVGGPFISTSYDYDAPIDEYGFPNEPKYSHLSEMHHLLMAYEDMLLGSEIPKPIVLGQNQSAFVYGDSNDAYLAFLCNSDDQKSATVVFKDKSYTLAKWSVIIVSRGVILFDSAKIQAKSLQKRDKNANEKERWQAVTEMKNPSYYSESIGVWSTDTIVSKTPMEQLSITRDDTDYLWYSTNVTLTNQTNNLLELEQANDVVYCFLNGYPCESTFEPKRGPKVTFAFNPKYVVEGENQLVLVTMTMGLINYGLHMESYQRGITGGVVMNGKNITMNSWTHIKGLKGEIERIYTFEGQGVVSWKEDFLQAVKKPFTWFKYTFDLPAYNTSIDNTPYALAIEGLSKGYAYINGRAIGRYWYVEADSISCDVCEYSGNYNANKCRMDCSAPTQLFYRVPKSWLRGKDNLLVVFEESGATDPSQVSLAVRDADVICNDEIFDSKNANELYLTCGPGKVISKIEFASFGTPTGGCGDYKVDEKCNSKDSKLIVSEYCLSHSYCSVPVLTDVFGVPCTEGKLKLAVQAVCG